LHLSPKLYDPNGIHHGHDDLVGIIKKDKSCCEKQRAVFQLKHNFQWRNENGKNDESDHKILPAGMRRVKNLCTARDSYL
jgi:hypothetical protein